MTGRLEIGSKQEIYLSFYSTISMIPTTLTYSPLFLIREGSAVEIMPDNFPMRAIVLRGNCPRNRGIALGVVVP